MGIKYSPSQCEANRLKRTRAVMNAERIASLPLKLERDYFLRTLVRELAGALEDVIGLSEAAGYISVVGARVGEQLNQDYRAALKVERLSVEEVGQVLVDLKRRIKGDFYILEENSDRIVFGNRACPFADKVIGRPSMCMMTSNVFGHIAADNLGYAKVSLDETIAHGHGQCRVVLHLKPTKEARAAEGREYFRKEQ